MVAERIEAACAGRRQRGERRLVVGLIEKAAGLSVDQQIRLQPVLAQTVDDARLLAVQQAGEAGEILEVARRAVVPGDHHAGIEAGPDDLGDLGARGVHRHRCRLEDRGVGIAIDHQSGEAVALGVGDAIGIAVEAHPQAQLQRGAQTLVDEVGQAGRLRLATAADHPQRQPGPRRPGGPAEPLAAPVFDGDQRRAAVAGVVGGPADDVGPVDPGVAGADSRRAACVHHGGRRILAHRFGGAS